MEFGRFQLRALSFLLLVAAGVDGCSDNSGFPRDPKKTLQRVNGGALRVGLVENPPWVVRSSGEPAGVEPELVRQFAAAIGAKPQWQWGGEQQQMEALEHYQLDLLIGGMTEKTPWKSDVGLTRPYFEKQVMATPPGENAWIKRLDEFLHAQSAAVKQRVDKDRP